MTLGGLAAAVGLVIDDAIVVVENIVLHRDAGQGRFEAIHSALKEITVPLIGSTITPIVVFLPLISITGVTGTFFRALAVTMAVSLLTSLALALTWTPTLSQYLIKKNRGSNGGRRAARPRTRLPIRQIARGGRSGLWWAASGRSSASMSVRCDLRWNAPDGWPLAACCSHRAFHRLLSLPGIGPAAGDGRRRLHPRLHHAGGKFAGGDEPRRQPHRTDPASDARGGEHVAANGLQLGLAAVTEANTGDISVKLKQSAAAGSKRSSPTFAPRSHKRSRRSTSSSSRCCRT